MSDIKPLPSYSTIALIVAAGRGSRTGCPIPKQYLPLQNIPMLRHSVQTFTNHPYIDAVCVVYHPEDEAFYLNAVNNITVLSPAHGGQTRQESVYLGLKHLKKYNPKHILIHDAARPLLPPSLINRLLEEIVPGTGVIPVLSIDDTIRQKNKIIDRSAMVRVQTPQGFTYTEILTAHEQARSKNPFTDDASLYEALGHNITTVPGSPLNFKITTPDDLMLAQQYLLSLSPTRFPENRTGMGYDVHAFGPAKSATNNHIMLCGIPVPHPASLMGHSDADVGLHALTDALLATIASGDIGEHFSDKDPTYKGMDSSHFVKHACDLIAHAHGTITHVDITIIGERPKISPHRLAMRQRIADILGINIERVSVKATTTEKLGFTGREEGIAAQAVASVAF
jgi:2-C-methyl-D-erythritol 4-phosphate cytidylyltransferase / 2-C-methyl-D-erythritol 2,4-cyclodiphosphate synthase